VQAREPNHGKKVEGGAPGVEYVGESLSMVSEIARVPVHIAVGIDVLDRLVLVRSSQHCLECLQKRAKGECGRRWVVRAITLVANG